MSQRVNVQFSDEFNKKLDDYAKKYGVSKSMICGFVIGQWLDNMEKANDAMYGTEGKKGLIQEIAKELTASSEFRNQLK